MRRVVIAISFVAAMTVACAAPPSPTLAPTPGPTTSLTVAPSLVPTDAPSPTPAAPTPAPDPTATDSPPTADEQSLIDGILRGAVDCVPVRDDLPPEAVAGVECASDEPSVARIGFYRFASDDAMLAAYFDRMEREGVAIESGGCIDGEGEGSYVPYEGVSPDRDGCFVNAEGFANYRATRSGDHVYIGILGRTDDMRALQDFAWRGNQDTPGGPTLWSASGT